MTEKRKEALEEIAELADRTADAHEDHDCATTPIMRFVSNAVRACNQRLNEPQRSGPVQVSTQRYRDNWSTIFGKKQPVGQA